MTLSRFFFGFFALILVLLFIFPLPPENFFLDMVEVHISALVENNASPSTSSISDSDSSNGQQETIVSPIVFAFEGYTFPQAHVFLQTEGQIEVFEQTANENGFFSGTLAFSDPGVYTFICWAEDEDGNATPTSSFSYAFLSGQTLMGEPIFLPPLIVEVEEGNLEGFTLPDAEIEIYGVSEEASATEVATVFADENGLFTLFSSDPTLQTYDSFFLDCHTAEASCGESHSFVTVDFSSLVRNFKNLPWAVSDSEIFYPSSSVNSLLSLEVTPLEEALPPEINTSTPPPGFKQWLPPVFSTLSLPPFSFVFDFFSFFARFF